ncbi:MAG TPA: SAM-dependent chlorinase/fluorinase [Anaerolineales bacterium]|nr:SAM-dependent chlorinase/fluorinase [Anaerolineales bacterium]
MTPPLIAVLTDFGTQDTYVGVMKGVIASIAPQTQVIDLTHEIPPGDIRQAGFKLWQAVPFFPEGTIFVVVVDPGVGTRRRAVAVAWSMRLFVLPDNGLLTYLLASAPASKAVELVTPAFRLNPASSTFHGRDVFSPAAAHLARGVPMDELGPPAGELIRLPLPKLVMTDDPRLQGEILHADRFGNLITSLGRLERRADSLAFVPWLPVCEEASLPQNDLWLHLEDGTRLELKSTFGDVPQGAPLAYIGSEGLVEVAVNKGSAADILGVKPGSRVELTYEGQG